MVSLMLKPLRGWPFRGCPETISGESSESPSGLPGSLSNFRSIIYYRCLRELDTDTGLITYLGVLLDLDLGCQDNDDSMRSAAICYAPADTVLARQLSAYLEINCPLTSIEDGVIRPGADFLDAVELGLSLDYV